MEHKYSPTDDSFYPSDMLDVYIDLPGDLISVDGSVYQSVLAARAEGLAYKIADDGASVSVAPSATHDWDVKTKQWVLNKTKQAELIVQAEQQAVEAVKHALQAHIDAVAVGLGFSGGNAVMLYAGFANAFQSLAQAFGAWEADIWAQANQYMAQVKSGDAPMLTPAQAVERVPPFVMPEQQKVGE